MTPETDLTWVDRPWGGYQVVYSDDTTTVKVLEVDPGQAISLQYHADRDEHWRLLSRQDPHVRFVINGRILTPLPDVLYAVRAREVHRITNNSSGTLRVLEIIKGRYDEEDIIRIHDKYGR